jgi:hypothetical protein
LFSTTVVAQEEGPIEEWTDFPTDDMPKPKMRLPAGEITTLGKTPYTCFNVDDYKEVLLLANEYQALYDWKLKTQVIAHTWKDLDQIYNERITNVKDQLQLLRNDRAILVQKITERDKYILNLERRRDVNVLGWKVVAGLELIGILTLSIASAVQK